jgi:hypothetical protein
LIEAKKEDLEKVHRKTIAYHVWDMGNLKKNNEMVFE